MRLSTQQFLIVLTFLLMSLIMGGVGVAGAPTDKASKKSGSSWPNFRNGLELRGVTTSSLPEKLELLWSHPIPDGMVFTSAVAVLDGRVYASTLGGELLCLELKSGKLLWKYLSAAKPEPDTFIPGFPSAPTVAADTVYVGDEDGVFHAVDRKTGKKRWLFRTQAEINSSAAVVGTRVIFGSYDANLYCLDIRTGKKVWSFETADRINGSPAIAGKYTFVTGCDQHLRMINIDTGKQEYDMALGSFMIASPAVVGDLLYVGTHDGEFLAVNWKKQEVVWRYSDPQKMQPYHASAAILGDRIVVGSQDKRVHCIDRKTGKRLWVFQTRAQVNSSPVIAGKRVYFGSADKHVYAIDLETGKELWKHRGKSDFNAAPSVADGRLLIGSEGGQARLLCFGAK